jgi:CubicO group peptidase (beta-lactamase class C family)
MGSRTVRLLAVLLLTTALTTPGTAATGLGPDLIERLDEAFGENLEKHEVPGGVLVVVHDGNILHARGFGVADLETERPVDPDETLFYLASVTKTFTATAVMQLVEAGKLQLDRDVNEDLRRVRVPPIFDEPVTLHHLLTHTAGFDDRNIGYVARSAEGRTLLADYLATSLPARVMPPGRIISYSNHGYGLAGYLVEIASGEPFETYVEAHILEPLEMSRSTAQTPPPPAFEKRMATGYALDFRTGTMEPVPLGARNIPPAGTVIATATDIGRYMLAHLGDGEKSGRRILGREMSRIQKSTQFTHHSDLPGIAYGFYERRRDGRRAIEHAGSYPGWFTLMTLFPEEGTGIFMATNMSAAAPHYATLDVLLAELWGEPAEVEPLVPQNDTEELRRFRGAYQPVRYSRTTVEKFAIFDTQVEVSVDAEGRLTIRPRHGKMEQWVQLAPLEFSRAGTAEKLVFRENEDGEITHLFRSVGDSQFPMAYERLHWHDRLAVQLPYLYAVGSILLASVVVWPLALVARWFLRRLRGRSTVATNGAGTAVGTAVFVSLLLLVFIAGLDSLLGNSRYRLQLIYGMTSEMYALLWVPIVTTILTAPVTWFALRAWQKRWWTIWGRAWYTIVAVTLLSFIPFFLNWRLLGFMY